MTKEQLVTEGVLPASTLEEHRAPVLWWIPGNGKITRSKWSIPKRMALVPFQQITSVVFLSSFGVKSWIVNDHQFWLHGGTYCNWKLHKIQQRRASHCAISKRAPTMVLTCCGYAVVWNLIKMVGTSKPKLNTNVGAIPYLLPEEFNERNCPSMLRLLAKSLGLSTWSTATNRYRNQLLTILKHQ